LGDGVKLTLAWIPAGEFVMGSLDGAPDERPRSVVRVSQPFWMAVTEVTNGQYALFDPQHDTRYIDMHSLDRVVPGHIANHPDQPVARVSWSEAMRFCQWLSRKTGLRVSLPTEAQWEWAARAGSESQFFYGTMETDFGRFANLADQALRWYKMGYDGPSALQRRHPYPPEMNFPLHDERFRDTWFVVDYVGQTEANAWGLKDMVGNVSEWTRSSYRPYPYRDDDGRNDEASLERKAARGGSWADRPADAGSSVRRAYQPWQRVYDVGFRVIVEGPAMAGQVTLATPPPRP
jgi:formylglycine-generating enzyme required for sulfatase activity